MCAWQFSMGASVPLWAVSEDGRQNFYGYLPRAQLLRGRVERRGDHSDNRPLRPHYCHLHHPGWQCDTLHVPAPGRDIFVGKRRAWGESLETILPWRYTLTAPLFWLQHIIRWSDIDSFSQRTLLILYKKDSDGWGCCVLHNVISRSIIQTYCDKKILFSPKMLIYSDLIA